jgi:tripartite-type tricarboxylate transporter receptor subunit TctC
MKKIFSAAAVLALVHLGPGAAFAQHEAYPARVVKIVVPFTPGGSNDVVARVLAPRLNELWKQPVVVENKAGGGGNIGAELVAKSPPDGYNLLVSGNGVACINPRLYTKANFDGINDLTLVTPLGAVPIVLVVHPSVPAKTVPELIAWG